jgi:hypothetical protein
MIATIAATGTKTLRNYTPHAITLYVGDISLCEIPSDGCARCEETREVVDHLVVDGSTYPICRTEFGRVVGLPDPEPGVQYIVSHPVALWAKFHDPDRTDLLVPDDAVRDEQGQPIGCRALAHV